jgi:hypothetical protein
MNWNFSIVLLSSCRQIKEHHLKSCHSVFRLQAHQYTIHRTCSHLALSSELLTAYLTSPHKLLSRQCRSIQCCHFCSLSIRNSDAFNSPYLSVSGKLWPQALVISSSIDVPIYILGSASTLHFYSPSLLGGSSFLFCYSSWMCFFYVTATSP